jgi:ribosomal protein RSM22 (predicted rRNA methylase)
MELPPALRQGVDLALEEVGLADLARAAEALSSRYRQEVHDGRPHIADDLAARAYLATRLPATFAAVRACLEAVGDARPDLDPRTILDAGAGPGTALWAAADRWPDLRDALLLEGSPAIRRWGEHLARDLPLAVAWRTADLTADSEGLDARDLVLLTYVLGEFRPQDRCAVIDRLWQATLDTLVIVEPGTPAGWTRILEARSRLVTLGAKLLAPCPHAAACPLVSPDWCHFARRVARSRLHRLAKSADVPWEDERFIYVAASRHEGRPSTARVIAPPRSASGRVWLKLCRPDGTAAERLFTRREGEVYKSARRKEWGAAVRNGP